MQFVCAIEKLACLESGDVDTSSLVLVVNDLDVAFAAHENRTLRVDLIGDEIQDALNLPLEHAGRRNSTSLFNNHGHGDAFVQETKLSLGRLGVSRVQIDTSVKDSTVNISNHGSNITGSVGLAAALEFFYSLLDRIVPVTRIPFVTRVNLLPSVLGEDHLFASVHKLTNSAIEAETVYVTALESENQFYCRTVGDVTSTDAISTRSEKIIDRTIATRLGLVDTKDGTHTDVAVNVTGTIEGVEGDTKLSTLTRRNDDRFFVFFRHENRAHATVNKSVDHHIIRKNIQLLLVVSRRVDLAGQTVQLGHASTLDRRSNELTRSGNGVEQDDEIVIMRVGHHETAQRFGIRVKLVRHG
mmetsp:Transcript_15040/g.28503  ORF Transcript_15040/g.28503 Transcript_15040/m.28503 type:complete len:356 (+) Transcript_15040:37-1104(+)